MEPVLFRIMSSGSSCSLVREKSICNGVRYMFIQAKNCSGSEAKKIGIAIGNSYKDSQLSVNIFSQCIALPAIFRGMSERIEYFAFPSRKKLLKISIAGKIAFNKFFKYKVKTIFTVKFSSLLIE